MKFCAREARQPGLHAKIVIPCNAFKERVHKPDNDSSCDQLRVKTRAFRDTPPEMMAGMAAAKVNKKKNLTSA